MSSEREASAARAAWRREQILEAAYKVFATKGYAAATIADVAQQLGLGHGTIYRYFENKLELFMAVIGLILERVGRVIIGEDPSLAHTLEEYRAQVARKSQRLMELLDSDPAIAKVLFYEAMGISEELDERIQIAWEAGAQVTAAYLMNGKARGFLRADLDVESTALAMHALMFEAGRRIVRAKDKEQARQRWQASVISLIFDGIGA